MSELQAKSFRVTVCKTVDGKEEWTTNVDHEQLEKAFVALKELRRAMYRATASPGTKEYDRQKLFVIGMTFGIESFLEMLKQGKN